MPLWKGSEMHCAPAMPTLFLKAAGKCPHVHQAQRLVWGSNNSKGSSEIQNQIHSKTDFSGLVSISCLSPELCREGSTFFRNRGNSGHNPTLSLLFFTPGFPKQL